MLVSYRIPINEMQIIYGNATDDWRTLFRTKFIYMIHGVCSVLSFYDVFAFQNCPLWCAESKGQTCIQENSDLSCMPYCILRSTKPKFCGVQ